MTASIVKSVRFGAGLWQWVEDEAARRGISPNALVVLAVQNLRPREPQYAENPPPRPAPFDVAYVEPSIPPEAAQPPEVAQRPMVRPRLSLPLGFQRPAPGSRLKGKK